MHLFTLQDVTMILYVEEAYEEPPNFEFKPGAACEPHFTCINVTKDGDSITFTGKLTDVPTNYTATLKNGTNITFIFGKESVIEATVLPTTESSPASSTPDGTQPGPQEHTALSSESNGNEDTGAGGDDQETVSTTSSGKLDSASATVLLIAIVIAFVA